MVSAALGRFTADDFRRRASAERAPHGVTDYGDHRLNPDLAPLFVHDRLRDAAVLIEHRAQKVLREKLGIAARRSPINGLSEGFLALGRHFLRSHWTLPSGRKAKPRRAVGAHH